MRYALVLLLTAVSFAQTPKRLEFEVAAVRPSGDVATNGAQTPAAAQLDSSQIRLTYLTMKDFVTRAYQVKAYQVVGPDWIASERYDIGATLPAGATTAQVPEMLRSLLEDRFGMKMHKAQKEFTVYTLGLNKRPFTLTQVQPRDTDSALVGVVPNTSGGGVNLRLPRGALFTFANNKMDGKGMTMDMLANNLSNFMGLPTVNRTNLDGFYDLHFDLDPEDFDSMMARAAANRGVQLPPEVMIQLDSMPNKSFLDSLAKVGLQLEKGKALLDVIVIDKVEKTPTEN